MFDIDEPGLAKARERFGEPADFVHAGGENMPLPDESLDLVVFNHIYEHVVDPDAVIAEIHRVLKPRRGCPTTRGRNTCRSTD
ncbi:class I SAM-dependent methyltransferase [Actinophytocola sp.]|uniref:class I SAM-dependent methyltransferase n=1 Tax=Actinophytocola sp. TaxID=1872138 RepID=UPI0025BDB1B7|nr:class I SAM-dependent methyltransferase [Actinophytocola sp.]